MRSQLRTAIVVLSLLLLGTSPLSGQMGLRLQGLTGQGNQLSGLEESRFMTTGWESGAYYWFRLKDLRIEFFPEVHYGRLQWSDAPVARQSVAGIGMPVSLYLFDLKSDCDCPTFSKQNDLFEKGFFVQVAPSISNLSTTGLVEPSGHLWTVRAAAGIGLDIGVSDMVTITPLLHYVHALHSWGRAELLLPTHSWRAGVQATFRPDYGRRR